TERQRPTDRRTS
ncbi:Protein of unknown function, partial [Gryllus bimaculatus]